MEGSHSPSKMDQLEQAKNNFKQTMCREVDVLFDLFVTELNSREINDQVTDSASQCGQDSAIIETIDNPNLNQTSINSISRHLSHPNSTPTQNESAQLLNLSAISDGAQLPNAISQFDNIDENSQQTPSDCALNSQVFGSNLNLDKVNIKEEIFDEDEQGLPVTNEDVLFRQSSLREIECSKNENRCLASIGKICDCPSCGSLLGTKRAIEHLNQDESTQEYSETPSKRQRNNSHSITTKKDIPHTHSSNVCQPQIVTLIVPAQNSAFTITTKSQPEMNVCLDSVKKEIVDSTCDELQNNDASPCQCGKCNDSCLNEHQTQFDQPEVNNADSEDGQVIPGRENEWLDLNEANVDDTSPNQNNTMTPNGDFINELNFPSMNACDASLNDDYHSFEENLHNQFEQFSSSDVFPLSNNMSDKTINDIVSETNRECISANSNNRLNIQKSITKVSNDCVEPTIITPDTPPTPNNIKIPRFSRLRSVSESSDLNADQLDKSKHTSVKPNESTSNHNSTSGNSNCPLDVQIIAIKCFQSGCCEKFSNKKFHNLHMKNEHNLLPIICPLVQCNRSFYDKGKLINHVTDDHFGITKWECAVCGLDLPTFKSLYRHSLLDHQEGHYKCPRCTFEADTRGPVINHHKHVHEHQLIAKSKTNENCQSNFSQSLLKSDQAVISADSKYVYLKYKCCIQGCNEIFDDSYQYTQHKTAVHKILSFRCLAQKCIKSFNTGEELKVHVLGDHKDPNEWLCYQCGKRLKDYVGYHQHVFYRHAEGVFGCSYQDCHFEDNTRMSIIAHYDETHLNHNQNKSLLTSTDNSFYEKPRFFRFKVLHIKCIKEGCNSVFTTGKIHYDRHLEREHGILPFQCLLPACGQSRNTLEALNNHIMVDHKNPAEFRCPHCSNDKIFHNYSKLFHHCQTFHQVGRFQCTFLNCNIRSNFRIDVIKHYEEQHHGQSSESDNSK